MTVRKAQPEDLADILRIQAAAPPAAAWSDAAWAEALRADGDSGAWVAVEKRPIAFLLCRTASDLEAEILNLAVDPARRRRGAARALLDLFIENNPVDIFLEVRASNSPAIELYRSLGFVDAGLRRAYYHSPVENAVVMRRTRNILLKQPERD